MGIQNEMMRFWSPGVYTWYLLTKKSIITEQVNPTIELSQCQHAGPEERQLNQTWLVREGVLKEEVPELSFEG